MNRAPSARRPNPAWKPRRLRLEPLEARLAPAYDLSISGLLATADVSVSTETGVTTFTANASGATLAVNDILAELQAGNDVVVDAGDLGGEAGAITWEAMADLDFDLISGARSLTLDTIGSITLNALLQDGNPATPDSLDLVLSAGEDVTVNTDLNSLASLAVNAGLNATLLEVTGVRGDVTVLASTITLAGSITVNGGSVTLTGDVTLDGPGDITIDTDALASGVGGDVRINGTLNDTAGDLALAINAPEAFVQFDGEVGGSVAPLSLTVSAAMTGVNGDITVGDASGVNSITFVGAVTFAASSTDLTVAGTSGGVTIEGEALFNGDLTVTLPTAFDSVNLVSGVVDLLGNALTTNGLIEVSGNFFTPGTLAGSGSVTANMVIVTSAGHLAPGGEGSPGTLTVNAPVLFESGSTLLIDLGPASTDKLVVDGAITVEDGVTLDGTGLPGAVPLTVVEGTSLTGRFVGTDPGQTFVLGDEAFTATYAATTLSLALADSGLSTVVGATLDGSIYNVRLIGPATAKLIVTDRKDGSPIDIVVRNSTAAHSLAITVSPNAGSGFLAVNALRVNGSIKAITAPAANLTGNARVTGLLGSINAASITALTAGGSAAQTTALVKTAYLGDLQLGSRLVTLQAENASGTIDLPSITTLRVAGNLGGDLILNAAATTAVALKTATIGSLFGATWDVKGKIGSVTVARDVFDATVGTTGPDAANPDSLGDIALFKVGQAATQLVINSVGRIATLIAGGLNDVIVRANTIGSLSTTANAATGATGVVSGLDLVLDAGSTSGLALGSATFAGTFVDFLDASVWDIRGRVGRVTARNGLIGLTLGTTGALAEFPDQLGDIAALTVTGAVQNVTINSVGRVGVITASNWLFSNLTAASLGKLTVGTARAPGRFDFSTVTITGAFGAAQHAIDSVLVTGVVANSLFDVQAGHVGSFTVGRFEDSQLYVGFIPDTVFGTGGTFTGMFTLKNFKTTQVFTSDLMQTLALRGSQVVAYRFGTVRISGVLTDNLDVLFGLRVDGVANVGSVQVTAPTPPFNPVVDLVPGFTADDFVFVA